ncbi:hypothetical protein ACOSP7_009958 [Xanthoceras sorbifolium]
MQQRPTLSEETLTLFKEARTPAADRQKNSRVVPDVESKPALAAVMATAAAAVTRAVVMAANVVSNAELQAKLMADEALNSSGISYMQGEFDKVCKRKRKLVLSDEWEMINEQIMVLQDKLLEALDWKFMHEENKILLGLYEKAMQERDEAA